VIASEAETAGNKPVQVRSPDVVIAVSPDRVGPLIVSQQEQNIGPFPLAIVAEKAPRRCNSRSSQSQFSKEIPPRHSSLIHLCLILCGERMIRMIFGPLLHGMIPESTCVDKSYPDNEAPTQR
jgi:hypothetical protein